MPRSSPNDSVDYALRADLLVHDVAYRHEGGVVSYEVQEDADGDHRAVVGEARAEPEGKRLDYEVSGVRLYPSRWERLRERLTSWEWEPEPEWEQVRRVTEQLEAAIEDARRAENRHTDCEVVRRT